VGLSQEANKKHNLQKQQKKNGEEKKREENSGGEKQHQGRIHPSKRTLKSGNRKGVTVVLGKVVKGDSAAEGGAPKGKFHLCRGRRGGE